MNMGLAVLVSRQALGVASHCGFAVLTLECCNAGLHRPRKCHMQEASHSKHTCPGLPAAAGGCARSQSPPPAAAPAGGAAGGEGG